MKNIAEHLRHLKFIIVSAIQGAQKFADLKTKDSLGAEAVLRYMGDMPMAGMPVTIVTPEGELPAPSGDYIAEDGSTIKVTDGVIMEIAAAPEPNSPPPATVEQNAPTPEPMTPKAIIESIVKESRFSEAVLEAVKEIMEAKDKALAEQKTEYDQKFAKQEAVIKQLTDIVGELAKQPAAGTTVKKKDGFKKSEGKKFIWDSDFTEEDFSKQTYKS